ncbi:uncharacterized protein EV420DRAFT_1563509 [Desarmillaria tabescens]|uniref:Uncharacterized protein n=1 Tax=Armillaria tabescens TaxID=1929756 RepID=A0AA39JX92_ARMTA|nr:uncharacterized protein EV420DRAFT_1563509 [Desarmillaria tabescens]KAK0450428.1 hypothetical protein EV420DRAFT_1563509 [Desarmillaria tabescens]
MSRVKSYLFWSTFQARQLVRNVLMKEPQFGMHHQQLFNEIVRQYPHEKLPTHLIPLQAEHTRGPPVHGGEYGKPEPALADHPVRSMRYLKKVILEDMLRLNEVEKIILTPDRDAKRTKTNALYVKHPGPINATQMYRWRVVPGSQPAEVADPDPEEMFEARRVEAWKKKVQEKNRLLPPDLRISTRHPPPPKREMWLREREARDKGIDDPFVYKDDVRNPHILSNAKSEYQRSSTSRRPEGVDHDIEEQDTFSSSPSRQNPNDDIYEDSEDGGLEDLEPEPASSVEEADEAGEQAVYDALFASDSDIEEDEDEDEDYTRTIPSYRQGSLNHRREFSLAAGQNAPPEPESRENPNLSIPPFPKFNEHEIPGLSDKERQRLESWRETFRQGVEEKIQKMKRDPANPMIKLLEDQYDAEDKPSQDEGPQINFLRHGLHSTVYKRPSKPRTPYKESELEGEDMTPSTRQRPSSPDTKPEGSSTSSDPSPRSQITFLKIEPYERSRRPRKPPKEPEPERWDRDLPEDILPPAIDVRKDAPMPIPDVTVRIGSTVDVRHSRATRLYESLARKSSTGPFAVPKLIIERDPATRPSKGDYLRSSTPRGPGDPRNPNRRVGDAEEIDDMLD